MTLNENGNKHSVEYTEISKSVCALWERPTISKYVKRFTEVAKYYLSSERFPIGFYDFEWRHKNSMAFRMPLPDSAITHFEYVVIFILTSDCQRKRRVNSIVGNIFYNIRWCAVSRTLCTIQNVSDFSVKEPGRCSGVFYLQNTLHIRSSTVMHSCRYWV